jgi:hypothetical protein
MVGEGVVVLLVGGGRDDVARLGREENVFVLLHADQEGQEMVLQGGRGGVRGLFAGKLAQSKVAGHAAWRA